VYREGGPGSCSRSFRLEFDSRTAAFLSVYVHTVRGCPVCAGNCVVARMLDRAEVTTLQRCASSTVGPQSTLRLEAVSVSEPGQKETEMAPKVEQYGDERASRGRA
jgi:hypothetical protein